jgi:hypothetical protein
MAVTICHGNPLEDGTEIEVPELARGTLDDHCLWCPEAQSQLQERAGS